MSILRCFLFLYATLTVAQTEIKSISIDSTVLKVDQIIAIDNFETIYYTKGPILYKKQKDQPAINYSNVQLGIPTSVNAFNPLKINVFYQDFNTVIILDNRLAEIFKIDFNTKHPYKNVSHMSTGHDNTLWIFNQDLQQLELYDYKTQKTRATTVPVQSEVLDLKSNYNHCWLLTENYLYQYTYFGSLITKFENTGYTALVMNNENIILQTTESLVYKPKKSTEFITLKTPKLLINQFLLTNETLYIYDSEKLYTYQLKIE